jgi:hypothetical protein
LSPACEDFGSFTTDNTSLSGQQSSEVKDTFSALAIAIALDRQKFVLRPRSRSATVLRDKPARPANVI